MKKYIYCALMALLCIACSKEDDPSMDTPIVIPQTLYGQAPIFESRALVEDQPISWDDSETVDSRTYAVVDPKNASEYFQYWSSGDAISMFFTTANLKYQMTSYKDGKNDEGIFELASDKISGEKLSTGYYYSVYPYKEDTEMYEGIVTYTFPETQHYNSERNGDSYSNGENGMIAIEPLENTDSILYFQNFCSYLQLRLAANAGESKIVKKITLMANNITDGIAGRGDVEFANGVPVVYMSRSASNQITLDCGSGVELSKDKENPTKFWFVLPGDFTFTQGFSVTITFSDNSVFKQSTSKTIGIERSHIKPMQTFIPKPTPSTDPIRYKYNSENKEEPFPLANTFYGENGEKLDIVDQIYDEETGEWVVILSGILKTIGDNSFEGPGSDIKYITIDNENNPVIVNSFAFYNCTADYITINNNVDEINESAFTGSTIKELVIDGDVTTIKNSAGTGSSIENIHITGDVETINEEAFSGCSKLKIIDIEGEVGTIEKQAFSNCNRLETVNIGSIKTIEYRAFYMCSGLTSVNIPNVKTLGMGAFRGCSSLTEISLMSVVTIDDNAFMDCSGLTKVNIGETCTMIGEGAFCNAISLKDVYCDAKEPPFIKTDNYNSSYAFANTHKELAIHIPAGTKTLYNNKNYFRNHTYDDPKVYADVNWWYEEYRSKLKETN